ncbi:NAD-dependent epimerase/dehydratase family protein [Pedobacter antarcticus]|uniref:NAD-dependent epimerase/dehydratase family protein n=1 Tax=Pedobacter antarcticus TaxID=34086 RepID=UPI001C592E66|nr:NAD-dependent epimerase/dehydratase family protein [Pedobacter antarcticus]
MTIKNIALTGGSGFVGSNLINYLGNQEQLHISLIGRSDLLTSTFAAKTDVIIHLAGKAHDLKKSSDPQEYYTVNFDLTKNLYDSFLKSDAKKFIFISSVKAAADSVEGSLDENRLANPVTPYGKSKLMAEEYIKSQPLPEGKSYYILRPCMIHGPGNKGNLNLLYQVVKKGIPYPLAAFENKRSFLSVENLCFVISELIYREDISSGIYNVADDVSLSTNEVVSILSVSLGKKPALWKISKGFIQFLAKIGDKLHLPLTTERLDKLTESYVVSNNKLTKALNKPLSLSAEEGLKLTANSFKNT